MADGSSSSPIQPIISNTTTPIDQQPQTLPDSHQTLHNNNNPIHPTLYPNNN
ncbi:hypothetical protein Hanom_Chr03g00267311 [Helianthus anomalus]